MKQYMKKRWRKIMAAFFAFVLIFDAMSGILYVAAQESGKVQLSPIYGDDKSLCPSTLTLNQDSGQTGEEEIVQKEPEIYQDDSEYDENLEIKSKRTENSKTYKLSDGSYVTETYFEPIHKKEDGEYVEIDNTLAQSKYARSATPIYQNKDGLYSFQVTGHEMTMENDDGQAIHIIHDEANLEVYNVKENVILYSEAYENIDLEYRLQGQSIQTNFYINGTTNVQNITFSIDKDNLKLKEENDALVFIDQQDNVIFSYTKPVLYDSDSQISPIGLTYQEEKNLVHITLALDKQWINDNARIYPLMMSSRVADESTEINVTTSYNRSAQPNKTSNYYDLFVGYEDGSLSGDVFLGVTRVYVHVSGMNLGSDKEILDAKLKLYKRLKATNQWNEIEIGKTAGYVKPSDATWNNKPAVTPISRTMVRSDAGWQEFDVTSYIQDIYNGKNNTIELKATNESSAYTPNVFSSESGTGMPKISVTYRDAFDVDPNLNIDTFDSEMRIFSIHNRGFEAFSFDGIAKPDSQVIFELVEKDQNKVVDTQFSKGNVSRYFVDPIYIINHLENTQIYTKDDINYTTDYIYKNKIPKFDVPYEYRVSVKDATSMSRVEFRSDAFIKYKVKNGDNLKNIASYYGVTITQIKEDNNLTKDTIQEDDILLIRLKKNNPKVSKDVYTPPIRTVEYKAKYVNRGPRCSSGTCEIIDPVNAATGNYFYESVDFSITDSDDFNFTRYYNSTGPQFSNIFGNGFTSPIESYLTYDKKGNILYFTGDGKIYEFTKVGNHYQSRKQDHLDISIQNERIVIQDLNNKDTYYFDQYGYLSQIIKKEGTIIYIDYDDYGLITEVSVGNKKIKLTYNANKLVKDITLPSGKTVRYKYDDQRNLIEMTDTKGYIEKYAYDKNNNLVSIVDKNGTVKTYNTYDDQGRVIRQKNGNGHQSTIEYKDQLTKITYSDGREDFYEFNEDYDIVKIKQDGKVTYQYTYDDNRQITSMTNKDGQTTQYSYDGYHLSKVTYSDGTSEEYQYDALGNVIYEKDREGNITHNQYVGYDLLSLSDSKNTHIIYVYDDKRRLIKETDQYGATKQYTYSGNMVSSITYSSGLVQKFEFDKNGNVTKESDNQGKVITYVYDANNQVTQKNYYDGTNEQWVYDGNGNISSYKDRIGGKTVYRYDKNNNLISSQKGSLETKNYYNSSNQLIKETDEQGLSTSYTYDVEGNKTSETDHYGNTIKYTYDANGNVTKTTDSFGNSEVHEYENNDLVQTTSKDGLITTYEYDDLHREIKKTDSHGHIETKEYDGLYLKKEVDNKGTTIEYVYDDYGRIIKTTSTYQDGQVSTTEYQYDMYSHVISKTVDGTKTAYRYDVYDQVIETTDALGHTTKKVYDLDGNVIKEIDALGHASKVTYDGNGNILSTTDKNGHQETKTYNKQGQLVSETDALGYVKTYQYNDKGQLITIIDPYQRVMTYEYDDHGNQIKAKLEDKVIETDEYDNHGRMILKETLDEKISTQYDDFDRQIQVTNELTGLSTNYTYDQYSNLIEEKDSEGLTITYQYDQYDRLIKTVDAGGRTEDIRYDDRDHVIETKTFDGTITASQYDIRGNIIESTDALGKVTKNEYNVLNQLIRQQSNQKITEYVYDYNGQLIEEKNLNNSTSIQTIYDNNGNPIENIDALGNHTKSEYDAKNQVIKTIDALGHETLQEYDGYGNVVKVTDALGNSKQTLYNQYGLVEKEIDERGFATQYTYNDRLQLIQVTDGKGNISQIEYNDHYQKAKEINPNGGQTSYEYDVYGRVIQTTEPNGKVIEIEYDVYNHIIKKTSNQQIFIYNYDELGRLTSSVLNDVVQVENVYNDNNQIIESYDANENKSIYRYNQDGHVVYSDEKGYVTQKDYDVEGNVIHQVDNQTYVKDYTYDANNQLLTIQINGKTTLRQEYDANGNVVKTIEDGVETRNKYDAKNQLIQVEIPSASTQQFVIYQTVEYDVSGNAVKITDALGNTEEKKYDANNNVIEEINKKGIKTLYEYDGLNNIKKVQNNDERYITYTYDEANNLTYKKIDDQIAQYKYDLNNNLIYEKDEYGYVNEYEYDNFNRMVKQTKPDSQTITYTYDHLGNILSKNDNTYTYDSQNHELTASNDTGTVTTTYDAFGHITSVKDPNGKSVEYNYNDDNLLQEKTYAGVHVTYDYDDNHQLSTVKKDNQQIAHYTYNSRNEIVELRTQKTVTQKAYDDMGRMISQKSSKNDQVIIDATYKYDVQDNLIEENMNGQKNSYQYDDYDELISSNKYINGKQVITTYQYDLFGNQIVHSSGENKTYTYNDHNQIETIKTDKGTIKYDYDDNGNVSKMTHENGQEDTYSYDELNHLIKLEQGQYTYEYQYDAQEQRISQTVIDNKDYHYDVWYNVTKPLNVISDEKTDDVFAELKKQATKKRNNHNLCASQLARDYDVTYFNESVTTEYLLDRNREYAEVLQANDDIYVYSDTLLLSNDQDIITGWNDSVIAKVGNDIEKISYSDYGVTQDIESGHGYNSEMLDSTGLIYLRARYYDPSTSRFIQIDNHYDGEQNDILSQNKYAYGLNNPYKYIDRDGKSAVASALTKAIKKIANKSNVGGFVSLTSAMNPPLNNLATIADNAKKAISTNKKTNIKGGGAIGASVLIKGLSAALNKKTKDIKVEAKCPEGEASVNVYTKIYNAVKDIPYITQKEAENKAGINKIESKLKKVYKNAVTIMIDVWHKAIMNEVKESNVVAYVNKNHKVNNSYDTSYSKQLVGHIQGGSGKYKRVIIAMDSDVQSIACRYFHEDTEQYDLYNNGAYKAMMLAHPFIKMGMGAYNTWAFKNMDSFRSQGVKQTLDQKWENGKNWLNEKWYKGKNWFEEQWAKIASKPGYSLFGKMSKRDGVRYRDWNYEKICEISIHNPDSNSMTLGKYFDGTIESGSYVAMAESTGDTYFSLGKTWDEIEEAYGLTDDDMFELFNKPALDDAVSQGKEIRFTQDPREWGKSSLGKEWEYLKQKHGYIDVKKRGNYWYGEK